MRLPYSWLKELSGIDWSPEETARRLTASGTACVLEMPNPEHFQNVVIGHITKLERHPNADRLVVTEVNTGDASHTVICGAPNCAVGQKVVLALPGANLKGELAVKPITMRGVKSAGMICAEDELGISADHAGIMVLDPDAPIGQPAFEYLGLDDPVFNLEITPNRPDCLSAIGVARELAVLAGRPYAPKIDPLHEGSRAASDFIKITIADSQACPRYAARIITGLKIGPSPWWIRRRLLACGMRPINNLVDITNYVMLETGQPLHGFDYDRFGSQEVVVRRATEGESFTTLDGKEHRLDPTVLMITNGHAGVAAAGVMGGLESEVADTTTTVLLESAYFDPGVVRKSARRLGLATESSYRFERGIDPNGVVRAADRAAAMMVRFGGGEVAAGVVDNYARTISPVKIALRPAQVRRISGADVAVPFTETTLRGLGMDVTSGDTLSVVVPTFRPDITREIDLVEEVIRVYGLDNIPVSRQNGGPLYTPTHRHHTIKTDIRNILIGLGFEETMGTGFAHAERLQKIDPGLDPIRVTNSMSDEFGVMRTRLLYSLLLSAGNNVRHRNMDLAIFEIGKVYLKGEKAPLEPEYAGVLLTGRPDGVYWKGKAFESDLFELKGVLAALAEGLGLEPVSLRLEPAPGYDPAQSVAILCGGQVVGHGGLVDRRICRMFDIKQDCFGAELELTQLIAPERARKPFVSLPKFPASTRDLAVIVDASVTAEAVLNEIRAVGGGLVEAASLFDLFTGEPVPAGKKSLAFSISYRAADKTLEDEEVDRVHGRIVEYLGQKFNARLRE
ncbi:MAG: phenylalanine--tRNA ligase subunit beta [candidate division Zixibacteria bacterium]|nr:phenylalanine--tRNA ligase subunit beta [candidate division Zixibacteria bacterium]